MSQRKTSREDQLLQVATRLFREKGYHNTSMQDLADAFGVQKASLYYYIESKEEITKRLGRGQSPDRADAYVNGLYYGKGVSETDKQGMIESGGDAHSVMVPDFVGV